MFAPSLRPHVSHGFPLISVVVCTYDRADLLAGLLKTLCEQTLNTSEYEIIVVDNNSTDSTLDTTEGFCDRYRNLRYCFEPQQGLSHARNRGWQVARGKYVGYIDDDCRVPEQWLSVATSVIHQVSPDVFGGPYYALYDTPKPRWFKDAYGTHEQGPEGRFLLDREYLDGGNIVFRRTLLESLGGFDPSLGMCGKKIGYGEETAMLNHIRAAMPEQLIYYDPELFVYHLVDIKKMSMRWVMRQRFTSGRYSYLTSRNSKPRESVAKVGARFAWKIALFSVDSSLGTIFRDCRKYSFFQNYLYERAFNHVTSLGFLFEQFKHL